MKSRSSAGAAAANPAPAESGNSEGSGHCGVGGAPQPLAADHPSGVSITGATFGTTFAADLTELLEADLRQGSVKELMDFLQGAPDHPQQPGIKAAAGKAEEGAAAEEEEAGRKRRRQAEDPVVDSRAAVLLAGGLMRMAAPLLERPSVEQMQQAFSSARPQSPPPQPPAGPAPPDLPSQPFAETSAMEVFCQSLMETKLPAP